MGKSSLDPARSLCNVSRDVKNPATLLLSTFIRGTNFIFPPQTDSTVRGSSFILLGRIFVTLCFDLRDKKPAHKLTQKLATRTNTLPHWVLKSDFNL